MGFYRSLVLPEILRVTRDQGIINIKKFYALKRLQNDYKFSIVVDSESELIKGVNLMKICEEFYENKILLANKTRCECDFINAQSKKFFPPKRLENDELYFWFNQPCIYKNDYLNEFWREFGCHNLKDFLKLNFYSFDFLIYGYFLLYFKGFKLENVEVLADFGFLECPEFEPLSDKFLHFKVKLCHPNLYEKLNNDEIFLFIQKNVQKNVAQNAKTMEQISQENYLYKTLQGWLRRLKFVAFKIKKIIKNKKNKRIKNKRIKNENF